MEHVYTEQECKDILAKWQEEANQKEQHLRMEWMKKNFAQLDEMQTKREQFSISILNGLCANPAYADYTTHPARAVELADELMSLLAKGESE